MPEIMNSDQGSHFTIPKYTEIFLNAGAKISMNHRVRAYDNIFIARLWRSVKYENVYIQAYETPREARKGINKYLTYYNNERPHQSLKYYTPADLYHARKRPNKGLVDIRPHSFHDPIDMWPLHPLDTL